MTVPMSDLRSFCLPDVGEGLTEAEVLRWHVSPGDVVDVHQVIVEIETAKAVVDLPCPYAGTVAELHAAEGSVVPVGSPLITIECAATSSGADSSGADAGPRAMGGERTAVLVGYGVRDDGAPVRRRRARPSGRTEPGESGRARAKPPVRHLARELGVDLSGVAATGERGEVTRTDVLAAAGRERGGPERVPVRGVHRAMAEAMVQSAFTAPHVTEWVDLDMSRALSILERLRREHPDARLTPMVLVAAALVRSAGQHPMINSTWVEEESGPHVHLHDEVSLGIATDTPRGLVVPVVRGAQGLGLLDLARRMRTLIDSAREGRSSPAELTGGTITLTNIGVFGIDGGTPILNPGQSAILAMGRILDRPWVVDASVVVRPVMTLSLSFDHRVIDGALASRALRSVVDYLEDPGAAVLLDRERPAPEGPPTG